MTTSSLRYGVGDPPYLRAFWGRLKDRATRADSPQGGGMLPEGCGRRNSVSPAYSSVKSSLSGVKPVLVLCLLFVVVMLFMLLLTVGVGSE